MQATFWEIEAQNSSEESPVERIQRHVKSASGLKAVKAQRPEPPPETGAASYSFLHGLNVPVPVAQGSTAAYWLVVGRT